LRSETHPTQLITRLPAALDSDPMRNADRVEVVLCCFVPSEADPHISLDPNWPDKTKQSSDYVLPENIVREPSSDSLPSLFSSFFLQFNIDGVG
jgi:hypothetical protein